MQREFTLLLLPLLSRKLKRIVPSLIPHPSLLAHTIYQALAFDAALVEEGFSLSGTSVGGKNGNAETWDGISEVILGEKEWFEAWMEGERKCKCAEFNSFLS
jgi:RAD50-interacting protein 1